MKSNNYTQIPMSKRLAMFAEQYGFIPDYEQVALLAGSSDETVYKYIRGGQSGSLRKQGINVPELGYTLPKPTVVEVAAPQPAAFDNSNSRIKEQIRKIWQEKLLEASEKGDTIAFYQAKSILKDLGNLEI